MNSIDLPVTTEEDFERQLASLVAEALRHGVDIEGCSICGSPPESLYEAEFVRLAPATN
ncbi:hypothetical protein [Halomarina oriensis]|uniref:Uncharacterized protein n=1 Tax=Halomarina oriensis TaxID=671145 RepID=A0A6B0GKN3_9EURY|nr:hypothetical protein [Halomarina oriensis]MWG35304.1 hypothetical protein [Halomarina oriensis]